MARLKLSFLGSFEVSLDSDTITTFESNKVRALLAYLATEGDRPHRREALATLLWPDWPQHSAMSNLRYALADLRKNIGDRDAQPPFLLITRESIQLNRQADVWVDVGEFESAIRDPQSAEASGFLARNLQSAIALYRGEFLEGFSLPDSPSFEQWVLARREDLHRQALQALFVLADAHEQQGNLEAALPYARRQVELEPWHEPGQQQLMRLLALTGQRSAALGQYEACRKALADELNVEPSAETKWLYEAIRDENMQGIRERGTGVAPAPYPLTPAVLPPAPGDPPFKGLQYFDVDDADLFFGREALTARLVGHIREMVDASVGASRSDKQGSLDDRDVVGASRSEIHGYSNDREGSPRQEECCFLAVVGASGSGKSSVVRAGVVPALQRGEALADGTLPPEGSPSWHIHVFTPTAHPLEALAVSLTRETGTVSDTAALLDSMAQDPRSVHLHAQRLLAPVSPGLTGKCRLLLVVDQFEELFTLCRSEAERTAFLDNLLKAVAGGGPTQVIVVLRADFYGHCAQYPLLRQALCSRQEYIGPMEANELRRAIELPAQQNSWDFEPGLVDLLLRDVGASEDHPPEPGALPLLEHALLETWKRRSGRTLTHQGYVDAGGVHGAIAKTAESVFTRLTLEQQALARRIFLRLTELGEGTQDTRRRAPLVELSLQPEDASQVESLLKILADARLITLSEDTAEVAHEALIREWPALRQWLSEDRDGLRLHRHLTDSAEAWAELERDPGELYRGARLAQAAEWADGHPDELNTLEREYLQVSQSQAEREAAEREAQRQHELEVAKQVAESARRLARTQRQRSLVLSLGLAIAVVLIGVALWLNSRANTSLRQAQDAQQTAQSEAYNRATQEAIANQQAQIAVSRQLAAQSLSLQKEEYPLALLQAVEASSIANTIQAQGNLLSSLNYNPRLQVSLQSQTKEVTSLAFSPDGKTLAVGNRDTTITLWDFSNPAAPIPLGQPLLGHAHHVTSVVFSPDGKMLASSSSDSTGDIGSIRLWDLSNPAVPSAFGQPLPASVESGIDTLVFSQDGKILVAGRFDGEIALWDISSPAAPITLVRKYSLSAGNINSIAISPDGKTLAAGCSDATIRFLDLSDPAAPIPMGDPLMQHTKEVASVVFSPDGKTLASGSYDHTVILWDLSNPAQPVPYGPPLAGHTDLVASIAFSPDGKTLASGSYDKTVILWDVSNPARPVLFDKPLKGHAGQVNSVTFSPDGKWLASGGCGQYSYFTCGQGQIILWDASRSKVLSRLGQPLAGHTDKVTGVVFNPNGKMLASGSADHTIRLWDVSSSATPVLLGQPLSGQVGISSIASSPDGQVLASGSDDATICLWDVSHPAAPILLGPAFSGHTDKVTSLVFSPDGKMLASGSNDATVILWDVSDPAAPLQLAPPLTGHFWFITSLAFSPDGKTLASGSYDSTIILWDVSKPDAPVLLGMPLTGHSMPVYSLAFSPDGKILASGGGDRSANLGSILMWDVSTPAAPVLLGQLLTGLSSPVYSLAFRPDGKQLATGNGDATIILWYVSDPAALVPLAQPLIGHTGEVWSLAYSPDGRRLVSGGSDGSLFLWEVSVDAWKNITCRIAGRNMTQAEWRQYLTGLPYHKTCAQWEEGK